MHPSHFYTSSSQGWEKCLVKVSFKSAYFASFGRAVKKCVKIAYFCTPEDCYGKFITCLVSIAKKIECTCFKFKFQICCFNRHSNLQSRMICGPDGAELHHTALLQCLCGVTAASTSGTASSAASWHCGVEWSPHSPDPSPLDFFLRVMLRLKRTHVREPPTVIEFKIPIARESPRSPPISGTLPALPIFCRFLHISLKSHQSW